MKAHLVLGAGGVRTLAYVGAIEKLEEANIEFLSISACSAGSLVGAALATGSSMRAVKQKVRELDLNLLISKPRLPQPFLFLTGLKWPFAKYAKSGIVAFMANLIGEGKTLGELEIEFAMPAIDIASKRLLVYSKTDHPEMKVEEAVKIAMGVPMLFSPHCIAEEGSIILDAAIATECPVWMVGRFDDEHPIIALRCTTKRSTAPPRTIGAFMESLIAASATCEDQYLMSQMDRLHEIAIDVSDYAFDDIQKAQRQKNDLFIRGGWAAEDFLQRWRTGRSMDLKLKSETNQNKIALRTASTMKGGFYSNRLSRGYRKKIFISYSHNDREWMKTIQTALEPYVGVHVWDDNRIAHGSRWDDDIQEALEQTRIALLMISDDFLQSDYIQTKELPYILNKRNDFALEIRWVALSEHQPLTGSLADELNLYQAYNGAKPLDQLHPRDLVQALASIGQDLALNLSGR